MNEALQKDLDAALARLPGPEALRRARREALDSFCAAGFPTRREENWRYTDLKPISGGGFDPLPLSPSAKSVAAARRLLGSAALPGPFAARLVFLDGHYCAELSSMDSAAGVTVESLASGTAALAAAIAPRPRLSAHPLAVLNSALAQHGASIRIAEGARIEHPIYLLFASGAASERKSLQPRVIVDLEPEAEASLILHFRDAGEPSAWINVVTHARLQARSGLKIYRFQTHGRTHLHTGLIQAEVGESAHFQVGSVDLGGRLVRTDVDVALAGPGASTSLFGLFMASEGQHVDNHTRIDHIAPETRSEEAFNGIVGTRGRGVFNGKVVVHRDAQRVDARQSSDNLLLGEQAEIDAKPELEIYADDVKCSHGATIGELDTEQLFYLRSRGLSDRTARELLTFAFANRVLERMDFPKLQTAVVAQIAERFPDHEGMEASS